MPTGHLDMEFGRFPFFCFMLRYRIESLYVSENGLRAVSGHRRILECLAKKDNIGIEAAIRDHLEQSKRDIHRFAFEMKKGTNSERD